MSNKFELLKQHTDNLIQKINDIENNLNNSTYIKKKLKNKI